MMANMPSYNNDKKEKLYKKLEDGTINASELRTLLGHFGWTLKRTKGSHEH